MIALSSSSWLVAALDGSGTPPYYATWADITASGLTAGAPSYGDLSGTSDVTIVASPAASTVRHVKFCSIINTGASTRVATVKIADGGGTRSIVSVSLAPGERLEYADGRGWTTYAATGGVKQSAVYGTPTINALNTVVLGADETNSNAVANTLEDVTGLLFAMTAGETYWFRATIPYTAAATTTGSRWTVNGPASPTLLNYRSQYTLTATTLTSNYATAYQIPAASNASSLTAGNIAIIEGVIKPSASGNLQVQHASEVAGSAITAKAGAILKWMRVL